MGFVTGPVAPENNPPINSDYYQPSRFVISAITLGTTTTVTTSASHNYVVGQTVRLLIPIPYGSFQLNETQGIVISVPSTTQVEINIDSGQNVDAFVSNPTYDLQTPQIVAVGDVNSGEINASGISNTSTYITGSFINISPQ